MVEIDKAIDHPEGDGAENLTNMTLKRKME